MALFRRAPLTNSPEVELRVPQALLILDRPFLCPGHSAAAETGGRQEILPQPEERLQSPVMQAWVGTRYWGEEGAWLGTQPYTCAISPGPRAAPCPATCHAPLSTLGPHKLIVWGFSKSHFLPFFGALCTRPLGKGFLVLCVGPWLRALCWGTGGVILELAALCSRRPVPSAPLLPGTAVRILGEHLPWVGPEAPEPILIGALRRV